MSCPSWLILTAVLAAPPMEPLPEGSADEAILRTAGVPVEGKALIEFFHTRARLETDWDKVRDLVKKLGDASPEVRAEATAGLVARGPLAIPLLRQAVNDPANLAADQARKCLKAVEGPGASTVPAAAARLLAARRPAGSAEAMLAYLPFADDETVAAEVGQALAVLAFADKQPDSALVAALQDAHPLRRAVAGEALCRPDKVPAVRKLLADPHPAVRLRVALALTRQRDAEAVPVLIGLLSDLQPAQRRQAEEALVELAGEWAPGLQKLGEDEISRRVRKEAWLAWWRTIDGPELLAEFRRRTLDDAGRKRIDDLIALLSSEQLDAREEAMRALVGYGPLAVPALRQAVKSPERERAVRAQSCLERISRAPALLPLPAVAARLVEMRKPDGAATVLLDFLPWAEGDDVQREISAVLASLAARGERPDPAFEKALGDASPVRRIAAAQALAKRGGQEASLRKLLKDADGEVRVRVALALAAALDKDAVPTLIDALGDAPMDVAVLAEEAMIQVGGDKRPELTLSDDAGTREKCRDAWATWWRDNGASADLSALTTPRDLLGYTLLVEVTGNNQGRVREIGRDGKTRWEFDNLAFPVDAQLLPGGRVLVAEWNSNKVTERDLKGNILWKKDLQSRPTNAQKLPSGNVFICTDQEVLEVDREGKTVWSQKFGSSLTAACRASGGETWVLVGNGTCVRLDARNQEAKRFPSNRSTSWTSGIDSVPGGKVLVSQPDKGQVSLFDRDGKVLWSAPAPGVTTATWLPDGHVLIASNDGKKVYELDQNGKKVWELANDRGVFRARRR